MVAPTRIASSVFLRDSRPVVVSNGNVQSPAMRKRCWAGAARDLRADGCSDGLRPPVQGERPAHSSPSLGPLRMMPCGPSFDLLSSDLSDRCHVSSGVTAACQSSRAPSACACARARVRARVRARWLGWRGQTEAGVLQVYDFGGGTLDVSLLQKDGGVFTVVRPAAPPRPKAGACQCRRCRAVGVHCGATGCGGCIGRQRLRLVQRCSLHVCIFRRLRRAAMLRLAARTSQMPSRTCAAHAMPCHAVPCRAAMGKRQAILLPGFLLLAFSLVSSIPWLPFLLPPLSSGRDAE